MEMTLNFPIYIPDPNNFNTAERQMYDYFASHGMPSVDRKSGSICMPSSEVKNIKSSSDSNN
jgi:hypothetical protein